MRHFINNNEIAPRNLQDIGVVSDFSGNPEELEITVDSVVLPREAKEYVENHIQTQGVFEGIPYQIELNPNITLDFYIDLTEEPIFRDHEIEVKLKKRYATDNFFDRAEGFTFELGIAKGVNYQFIDVPYIIVRDNVAELSISLGISLYVMTREAIQATKDLITATRDLIEALTPNATIPPLPPVGEIISLALAVVAQLAYTIAIYFAVLKLAQQLFDVIFPKIRYYKACKVKELIEKSANYLGYTLQSTLLDSLPGLTILPVPLVKEKKSIFDYIENDLNFSFTKGVPTSSDSTPTLKSLIDAIEDQFNARTKVRNGIVQIERRDFWQNITPNQLTPALTLQDTRSDEYRLNTPDIWKRYYIHYERDYSDTHTIDFYDPTDAEYSTEPLNVVNADLITIKGLHEVTIPFALGVRKNSLNFIEKLAKGLFEVIDAITGIFGGGTNYASIITNRIGVLQISQQFYSRTKMLYTTGTSGKQPVNYVDYLSAPKLWQNYHSINQIQVYDFKVREATRLRISAEDFVNLLDNNYAEINGLICEILRIEWIDEKSDAKISYREPFDYANGKVETIVINE